jgi:hypothetical protein
LEDVRFVKRKNHPGFTVSERIVGAILVIARFNPLKKFGPLTGRTRNAGRAPTHAPLQEKEKIWWWI